MGIFDLFGKETRTGTTSSNNSRLNKIMSDEIKEEKLTNDTATKGPVSVFKPASFSDVETIINCLKSGKTAIVHLSDVKTNTAIRILDLLSGAVYALNGGVYEMEANIFMFSPSGVEIH